MFQTVAAGSVTTTKRRDAHESIRFPISKHRIDETIKLLSKIQLTDRNKHLLRWRRYSNDHGRQTHINGCSSVMRCATFWFVSFVIHFFRWCNHWFWRPQHRPERSLNKPKQSSWSMIGSNFGPHYADLEVPTSQCEGFRSVQSPSTTIYGRRRAAS